MFKRRDAVMSCLSKGISLKDKFRLHSCLVLRATSVFFNIASQVQSTHTVLGDAECASVDGNLVLHVFQTTIFEGKMV